MIAFGYWTVGFCEAVDVNGEEIEICHLLEQMGCWG